MHICVYCVANHATFSYTLARSLTHFSLVRWLFHRFKFRTGEPKNVASVLNYSRSSLSQYLCLACKFAVWCVCLCCEYSKAHRDQIELNPVNNKSNNKAMYVLKLTTGTEMRAISFRIRDSLVLYAPVVSS